MPVFKDLLPDVDEQLKPHFAHVGLLVKDLESAVKALDWIPNKKPWFFKDTTFAAENLLVGAPFKIKIGLTEIDGIGIEMLQPYDAYGSYMENYINEHGEGLHHFAFDFDSHEEHISIARKMDDAGYKVVHHGLINGVEVHYYDTKNGIVIELKSKLPDDERKFSLLG